MTGGSRRVDLGDLHILATGGLGALATAFALSAARAGARMTLAELPEVLEDKHRVEDVRAAFEAAGVAPPSLVALDVTQVEACVAVVADADPVDVVINFAGVHHAPMDLAADDPTILMGSFSRVMRVNLEGAFALTVAAARTFVPRRTGHIIHLCSNGSRASLYGSYAYNASKHGVEGLVKTAAAQLAPFGVRVNGIAPGTVITDLNRGLNFDPDGTVRPRAKSILAHTPTKRFATAEGVAQTLLAMCLPQRHFTGNVVFADDGYNVEGHSWPEGNEALYDPRGFAALDELYAAIDRRYPREEPGH